jgi:hypothetical protein
MSWHQLGAASALSSDLASHILRRRETQEEDTAIFSLLFAPFRPRTVFSTQLQPSSFVGPFSSTPDTSAMDKLLEYLPSAEKGYLPYYLFFVSPSEQT